MCRPSSTSVAQPTASASSRASTWHAGSRLITRRSSPEWPPEDDAGSLAEVAGLEQARPSESAMSVRRKEREPPGELIPTAIEELARIDGPPHRPCHYSDNGR